MSEATRTRRRFVVIATAVLLGVATPVVSLLDTNTVSADVVTSGGFTTSAQPDRTSVAIGQTVNVTSSVKSTNAGRRLVDVEVYDRTGRKVFQQYWDNQSFTAGQTRTFASAWRVPTGSTTGAYTVKIGVFSAGWGTLYHWSNTAGAFSVSSTAPTTTVAPTTTRPPTTTVAPTTTRPPTTTVAPTTTRPPTTTVAPTTTRPPTTTVAPTTTRPPTTTVPPTGHFNTLPVGAALPSGADCAARVRPAAEIRPENAAANALRGTRANANTRTDWSGFNRVDGAFSGTTDEIIQWAACKWGIDEDIVRAQLVKESYWYMSANGDNGESWGLGQVRDTAHQSAFQYSVNARNSSAYNLDYTYASWRGCYEGVYTWLNTVERGAQYAAGDVWGCVGVWFSGRWYLNNDAYLNQNGDSVRWHYNNKTWLTSTFING